MINREKREKKGKRKENETEGDKEIDRPLSSPFITCLTNLESQLTQSFSDIHWSVCVSVYVCECMCVHVCVCYLHCEQNNNFFVPNFNFLVDAPVAVRCHPFSEEEIQNFIQTITRSEERRVG